jgi:iron(II)-dependent oxidoreductase
VDELERRIAFGAALAKGDELVSTRSWQPALAAFEKCLEIADDKEAKDVEPRLRAVKAEIAYDDELAAALAALEAEDPNLAMEHATSAASMKPDEGRPKELILAARKAIGPDAALTDSLQIELVLIPAGEFPMGSASGDTDEQPPHSVHVDSYYISKYEITNAQFEQFDATHRRTEYSGGDAMPVVAVSWDDASAFCRWLSKKEEIEYRLPTEAEWEKAARGSNATAFPWGNDGAGSDSVWRANVATGDDRDSWAEDGFKHAAPVGSFQSGASPYGVMDMSGNVWEWCLDWYSKGYYGTDANDNPTGPAVGKWRVYRGGSFANPTSSARCANRAAQKPGFVEASIGFRVVRALDPIFREESPQE